MAKYKLLAGSHQGPSSHGQDARAYRTGDIVESEHDLVRVHGAEKFERVPEAAAPVNTATPAVQAAVAAGIAELSPPAPVAPPAAPPAPPSALGTDITADFPTAEEADLKVYKRGRNYFVAKPGSAEALNEEPLTNREKVVDFVDAAVKAQAPA